MGKKDTRAVQTAGVKIKKRKFETGAPGVIEIQSDLEATIAGGPAIRNEAASNTNPVILKVDDYKMPGYHPGDVDVEETGDDYIAYRKTTKGKEPFSYPEHRNGEHLDQWVKKLSDSQLEAAIQIYYDRWAFGSGEAIEKIYFDSLDSERSRRRCIKEVATPTILPNTNDPDTGFGRGG